MIRNLCIIFPSLLALLGFSLNTSNFKYYSILSDSTAIGFKNPLFDNPIADPSVMYDEDTKMFYAYGTADSWADKKGVRLIPILESADMVNWTYTGTAFTKKNKPSWKEGGFWAPDVVKVGNNYHLYYSISVWHDKDPSIGVAVANSPKGPFEDQGKIISTLEIGVPNSIDPFYFEEKGKKYLFWGSFHSSSAQGTYGVELTKDGLSVKDANKKFKIAAGDWEAVVIHKKGNYYYMFGSRGTCCEGANSKYHVLVGRSKSLFGPYLDKNGKNIAERGNGTVVLKGNTNVAGPGHSSRIFTDKDGNDWIFYHGIEPHNAVLSNGINRRLLMMDRVLWEYGWPTINDGTPSLINTIKPKL